MNSTARSVLVTGAGGFIGRNLLLEMTKRGWHTRGAVRKQSILPDGVEQVVIGEVDGQTQWEDALRGADTVIHLAARAHVLHDTAEDPIAAFRNVNVAGARKLAHEAALSGVKRLVYVSSVGVQGLQTQLGKPCSEIDPPHPHNAYARSKLEAEQALMLESRESGMEVVIVRPPLVYGAGAPGNFDHMMRALLKRIPLPFGSVRNLRSLIYVHNLVDALIVCASHPAAAGQVYLVSDGEDVSTPGLLHYLSSAMGIHERIWACPVSLLKLAGHLAGRAGQVDRLIESLQIDSGKIRRELDWKPPFTLQQGLQATGERYRKVRP